MFVLVIGGTEVCRIPGISMAGSSPHAVPFTAPADAEVLWWGRGGGVVRRVPGSSRSPDDLPHGGTLRGHDLRRVRAGSRLRDQASSSSTVWP